MPQPFVPPDFDVPTEFEGPGFDLEPLGPDHNEQDYEAWTSSIEHIRSTPGYDSSGWPTPMTLEDNMSDLRMHARHFADREGFTYSILDGKTVVGCVYIYPSDSPIYDTQVRSWVRADRPEMDMIVWRAVSAWLDEEWPFENPNYAPRG